MLTARARRCIATTAFSWSQTHGVVAYRVGQKSELLILSEYVNKTEKIGGM